MIPKESTTETRKSIINNPINISTSAIYLGKPKDKNFEQVLQTNLSNDNNFGESSGINLKQNSDTSLSQINQTEEASKTTTTSWLEQIQFKAQYYHFRTNNYAAIVNLQKEGKLGRFRPESVEVIKDPGTVPAAHQSSSCSVPKTKTVPVTQTQTQPPSSPHRNSLCWNFPRVNFRTLFSAKSLDDILGGGSCTSTNKQREISEQVPKTLHPPTTTTQEVTYLGPKSRPRSSSSQSQNKVVVLGTGAGTSSGAERTAISASSTPDIQITNRPFGFQYPLIQQLNPQHLSASSSEDNCYFTTKPLRVHPIRNSLGKEGSSRSTPVSESVSPGPLLIVGCSSGAKSDNCINNSSPSHPPTTVPKKFSIPSILHHPSPDEPPGKKATGKRIHFVNKVEPIVAGASGTTMTSPLSDRGGSSMSMGPGDQALKLVVASVSYLQRPSSPSTFIVTGRSVSSPCSPQIHSPVTTEIITSLPAHPQSLPPAHIEPSPAKIVSSSKIGSGSGTNNRNGDNEISRPSVVSVTSKPTASCSVPSKTSTPNKKISTPPNPTHHHHHHQQSSFFTSCCSRRTVSTEEDEQSSNKELSDEDDNNDEIAKNGKDDEPNKPKSEIVNNKSKTGDSLRKQSSINRNDKSKTVDIEEFKCARRKQQVESEETDNMGDLQSPQYVKKTAHMFNTKYSNGGTNGTIQNGSSSPSYINVSRSVSGYSCLTYGHQQPTSHSHHTHSTSITNGNYTNGTSHKYFGHSRNLGTTNNSISPAYKNILNQVSTDPENCPPPLPQTAPPLSSPYLVGKNQNYHSKSTSSREHSPSPGNPDSKSTSIIMERIERLYGSGAVASPNVTTTYFWRKRTPPPQQQQGSNVSTTERIIPITIEKEQTSAYTNGHGHGSKSLSIQTDNHLEEDSIGKSSCANGTYPTTTTFVTQIDNDHQNPSSPGKNDKGTLIKEGPVGRDSEILTTYSTTKSIISSPLINKEDSYSTDAPDSEITITRMPPLNSKIVDQNNVNESQEIRQKNGEYFLRELKREKCIIQKLIDDAQNKLEIDGLDEDESGMVRAAIGKARLLINKKFKQFEELCLTNLDEAKNGLANDETKPTKDEDLEGFWDMVLIQVEQIHEMFSGETEKPDDKVQNPPKVTGPTTTSKSKTPMSSAKTKPKSSSKTANAARDEQRRRLIAEKRKAMLEQQQQEQVSSASTEILDPEVIIFAPK